MNVMLKVNTFRRFSRYIGIGRVHKVQDVLNITVRGFILFQAQRSTPSGQFCSAITPSTIGFLRVEKKGMYFKV